VDLEQVDLALADQQAVERLLALGLVGAEEAVAEQAGPSLAGRAAEGGVALELLGQAIGLAEAYAADAVVGVGVEERQPVGRDGQALAQALAVLLQPVALPFQAGDLLLPGFLVLGLALGGRRRLLPAVAVGLLALQPPLLRGGDLPL